MTINMDNGSPHSKVQRLHSNIDVLQPSKPWKPIQPYWNDLKLFLFSQNLNQMQSLIITAMYWYGDASKETENEISKFLKYIYGLESLVIFDKTYGKKKRMAQRLATIFSKNNRNSNVNSTFYDNLFQQYYDKRNNIVHAGKLNMNPEDVDAVGSALRDLIFIYISFSKKYTDVKIMFKNEFSIEV